MAISPKFLGKIMGKNKHINVETSIIVYPASIKLGCADVGPHNFSETPVIAIEIKLFL